MAEAAALNKLTASSFFALHKKFTDLFPHLP
jgi:hypothetical protein